MSTEVQYLTNEKLGELQKELEHLRVERRKEVAEHLEYSKKLGDLSENAEYHQAREEQAEVEDRIGKLENILKNAVVIDTGGTTEVVNIGSTIRLEKDGDNKSYIYTIVGSEEADTAHGKISNLSPIGSAALGHKKGDIIKVTTPSGVVTYTIVIIK